MDDAVLRSMAKWPNVPDVYGWLSLDRRGNFLIKGERIGNSAVREFIARNYQPDARGCWHFQNGPQRVFVELAYMPLVIHMEGEALFDHCARPFRCSQAYLDDEGSVLMLGDRGPGLLDDRDLAAWADRAQELPQVPRAGAAERFGFVQIPASGILARA
jgi:hypothetical protein